MAINDYLGEEKPKIKKKKTKKLGWHVSALVALIAIGFITLLGGMIYFKIQADNNAKIIHFLKDSDNQTVEGLQKTLAAANKKMGELKQELKKLNSFANAAHMEAKKARFIAEEEKTYGKDMEKLAMTHASTFQKLRIEIEMLSGKLGAEKSKANAYVEDIKRSTDWLNTYKDIIEKQKAEIARLQKAYEELQEKYYKK